MVVQGVATGSESGSSNAPDHVIPDGQGGALATWFEVPNPELPVSQPIMVTHLSPTGGGTYSLPLLYAPQLVLGENGVAFAAEPVEMVGVGGHGQKVVSFDMNSGLVLWTYEAQQYQPQLAPTNVLYVLAATSDNGLAVLDGQSLVQLDSQGVPVTVGSILATGPPTYSWSQQW